MTTMDGDSCAHLGIMARLEKDFARELRKTPAPIAPCSDDEVDPTTPARPVSQRDED